MSGLVAGSRPRFALLLAATVALGLAVRLLPLHLPFFIWKYAGSALWAAAVYFLLALAAPRLRPGRMAGLAGAVSLMVELSRLVPQPAVDRFRLTLAGRLLLGRIFGWRNLVAYAVGITAAAWLDRQRRRSMHTDGP